MNKKNLLRKVGGLMLAVILLPGIAMLAGSTAQAQGRWRGGHRGRAVVIAPRIGFGPRWGWYGYPYARSGYSQFVFANTAAAESQGYHDGLMTGSDDARKGKSNDPERSHFFQDAGFGNFADAYREGFENGYRAGFNS